MPSSQKAASLAQNINNRLEKLIPVTTPLGVALGIFLSALFIHLRPLVPFLFGLMTFSGALKLRAAEIGISMRRPAPILIFFACAHIIMPVATLFFSSLFFKSADTVTGFVLLFAGPTAVSGFFWIIIFKGDKALGLTILFLDTVLAPFVVPATISVLLGRTVSMDMTGIAVSLALMVVLPTILGVGINEASGGKAPGFLCPYLDPLSKLCLVLVIAANASRVFQNNDVSFILNWKIAAVCVILIIFGFVIMFIASFLFKTKKDTGISLVILGGLRNNSASMTIAVAFFPDEVALPVIMSLIFQQTIAVIAGKIIAREKKEN